MAVIERGETAGAVVRHAALLAGASGASLVAFRAESDPTGPAIQPALDLAARLGGIIEIASGANPLLPILETARRRNATHVVIAARPAWQIPFMSRRRLPARLAAQGIACTTLTISAPAPAPAPAAPARPGRMLHGLIPYLATLAATATATGIGIFARDALPREATGFVFIAIIAGTASLSGVGPGLFAAACGFLVWNFFFLPPVFTFSVADPRDVVALAVFLGLGLLTGTLAGRVRQEAEAARGRIEALRRIALFGRHLAAATDEASLRAAIEREAAALAGPALTILAAPDHNGLEDNPLDAVSLAAARHAFRVRRPAGMGTATLPAAPWRFLPLVNDDTSLGVLGIRATSSLAAPTLQALAALADQAALALERLRLAASTADARAQETTQRLRSALLSSLSHDLRTPLTAIRGAAETLATGLALSDATRADLLRAIVQDTARMTRFLANITGMARIETGEIIARRETVPIGPTIEAAIGRVPDAFHAGVHCDVSAAIADPALLEQVLVNLLENAVKYAPPGSAITVFAHAAGGSVAIGVADEGVGIAEEDLTRVFDSDFRARRGDRIAPGTGLGLAIARAFVEAMGGGIAAESPRPDLPRDGSPGTRIIFHLPAVPLA